MKKTLITLIGLAALSLAGVQAQLLISQYVETETGASPKGIELWNAGSTTIDFTTSNLTVLQGTNGAALTSIAAITTATGTLPAGSVLVIGTADLGTYLTNTFGSGVVKFVSYTFTFNGDDAIQIQLGGVVQDTLGTPGTDPGASWSGNSVSTANQNISLKTGITTGDTVGSADPSIRFETTSTTPSSNLSGFGVAPVAVPEPSTWALIGIGSAFLLWRIRRKNSAV